MENQESQACRHDHNGTAPHDYSACIRLVPIFNHLEDQHMDRIAKSARTMELQKNETLFRAGEKDDTLYIIHTGKVRIYRLSDSGKEQLVRILNPGDFTGEFAIFRPGEVHENYAEAMQKSSICLIKQSDLQQYLYEFPQISLMMLSEMTARLQESEKQTAQVSTENVESRILSFLLDCLEPDSGNNPIIQLPISKKDLASYLGTTPETISRKLASLESEGIITLLPKNAIGIPDLDQLLLYGKS